MLQEQLSVRLDQINVPAENPRDSYAPAALKRLKASIETHGFLVPLIVRRMGDEFALVDGFTRIGLARELGWPADAAVPIAVLGGDDRSTLVAAVVINQDRQRLSKLSEWRALRGLRAKGMSPSEAGAALGKSRTWASTLQKLDELPGEVRAAIEAGEVELSHGLVMADYVDQPRILDELVQQSRKGQASTRTLRRIGETATSEGITAARRVVPKKTPLSAKSWVRVEPVSRGTRFELHLATGDDPEQVLAKLAAEIARVRPPRKQAAET